MPKSKKLHQVEIVFKNIFKNSYPVHLECHRAFEYCCGPKKVENHCSKWLIKMIYLLHKPRLPMSQRMESYRLTFTVSSLTLVG